MAEKKEMTATVVPLSEKLCLTIPEASKLTGIGVNKLYDMTNEEGCQFVIYVGSRRMIKRKPFEKYLEGAYSI